MHFRFGTIFSLLLFSSTARAECSADVIQKWNGSGMMTTRPFHVDGPWEIQWAFSTKPTLFQILVYPVGSDNMPEVAANQLDDTPNSAYQPSGGNYYLKVNSFGGNWIACAVSISATSLPEGKKEDDVFNQKNILAPMPETKVFSVSSGSMTPTILISERVLVDIDVYKQNMPSRGDLAIFKLPRDNSTNYVKRVIGLPGDKIKMTGGQLFINGSQVSRVNAGEGLDSSGGSPIRLKRYVETLPGGKQYYIFKASDNEPLDNTIEYDVPLGNLFTLGDNRDNSLDSRVLSAVGYIPVKNLVGRLTAVAWSPNLRRIGTPLQ